MKLHLHKRILCWWTLLHVPQSKRFFCWPRYLCHSQTNFVAFVATCDTSQQIVLLITLLVPRFNKLCSSSRYLWHSQTNFITLLVTQSNQFYYATCATVKTILLLFSLLVPHSPAYCVSGRVRGSLWWVSEVATLPWYPHNDPLIVEQIDLFLFIVLLGCSPKGWWRQRVLHIRTGQAEHAAWWTSSTEER